MNPKAVLLRWSRSPQNVKFRELTAVLRALGFEHIRTKGSHQIWAHPRVKDGQLNLQSERGEVKPYQIRQAIKFIEAYDLADE